MGGPVTSVGGGRGVCPGVTLTTSHRLSVRGGNNTSGNELNFDNFTQCFFLCFFSKN